MTCDTVSNTRGTVRYVHKSPKNASSQELFQYLLVITKDSAKDPLLLCSLQKPTAKSATIAALHPPQTLFLLRIRVGPESPQQVGESTLRDRPAPSGRYGGAPGSRTLHCRNSR